VWRFYVTLRAIVVSVTAEQANECIRQAADAVSAPFLYPRVVTPDHIRL
jgi:hypothetical protein